MGQGLGAVRGSGLGSVPSESRAPCSALPRLSILTLPTSLGFHAAESSSGHASWEEGVG